MTLTISDPDDTVNLDNANVINLARDGYRRKGAIKGPTGDYLPVTERLRFRWQTEDDTTRTTLLQALGRLGDRAIANRSPTSVNFNNPDNWVRMESNTPSGGGTIYDVIRRIDIRELDARHYGPDQWVDLEIEIERDGAPLQVSPGGTPVTIATGTSFDMFGDHQAISAAQAAGDADGLPIFELSAPATFTLSYRNADQQTLTNYSSWLGTGDLDPSSDYDSLASDTGFPSNQYAKWNSGTSDADAQFVFNPQNGYVGTFAVYLVCRKFPMSTAFDTHYNYKSYEGFTFSQPSGVAPYWGVFPGAFPNPATDWAVIYVDTISVATGGLILGQNPTNEWSVHFRVFRSVAREVHIAGMYLIPVDRVFAGEFLQSATTIIIDSQIKRVYGVDASSRVVGPGATSSGRYLTIPPGVNSRIYGHSLNTQWASAYEGPLYDPSDTWTMTTRLIPRYRTLR